MLTALGFVGFHRAGHKARITMVTSRILHEHDRVPCHSADLAYKALEHVAVSIVVENRCCKSQIHGCIGEWKMLAVGFVELDDGFVPL